jgi:hypothetical protein
MDDLKLLSGSDEELENETNIVKAISKDINMNLGLKNVQKFVKKRRLQRRTYIESTFEKDIKELDPRKA